MASDTRAQILQATDLVELVGQTVALKRRGKSFVGLCPFHSEKTPSFHVDPAKQYFKCYGCKAGGTAYDFVMLRDRVEFKEAMEILARAAGIEIPRVGGDRRNPGERQLLLDIHQAAAVFFENQFSLPSAAPAREYLAGRGFTPETLKRFRVGMAPPGWDNLLRSEVGRKFSPGHLALAGLVKPRERGDGHYDTFRNRIMFPIRNESGQIIAFGGRKMPDSDDPAKYLNSPEHPLFSKSRSAFGLDLAKQRIVETRTVAIVEGYTDVIMAHQFGASNVVSPLGTALTEQHVGLLRRYADRIVLLFDADDAGNTAVDRSVQLFLTQPVEIHVASLPDGLDPDEFFMKFGAEAFEQLLAGADDALGHAWKQMFRRLQAPETDLLAREKAVRDYLELLASGTKGGPVDPIRWSTALARVSRLTGLPAAELHAQFMPRKAHPRPRQTDPPDSSPPTAANRAPLTGLQVAEQQIIGALLLEPSRWQKAQMVVTLEDFSPGLVRRLAEIYWNHQLDEGEPVLNEFLAGVDDAELKDLAIELVELVQRLPDLDQTLDGALGFLKEERRRRQQREMQALAMSAADAPEDVQIELLRRIAESARRPDIRRLGS